MSKRKKNKQASKQTIMWTHMHTGWKMSKCNSGKTRITNLAITRSKKNSNNTGKKAKHQENMHKKIMHARSCNVHTKAHQRGLLSPTKPGQRRLQHFWQIVNS